MVLPYVDYSPVRTSMQSLTNSKLSKISFDKMRLQEKQNSINTALGFARLGLDVGQTIYNAFEAKKLEEAKKLIYEEDQALRDEVHKGIYDGSIKVETFMGESGPETQIIMPENFDERLNRFESGLEENFKGFPEVRRWAKEASRKNTDNAKTWAYKVAFEKSMEDRDKAFSTNLEMAYKGAVKTGDPGVYETQIESATWLSKDRKDVLKAELNKKYQYDTYENEVYEIVKQGDLPAAIKKAAAYIGADEDKTTLRKRAIERYNDLEKATTTEFLQEYEQGKELGRTPKDIIKTLQEKDVPERYKKAAIEEVRKQQTNDAIIYGHAKFNENRDEPAALRKAYQDIKNGAGSLQFDGIDVTHKAILDMFEKRLDEIDYTMSVAGGTENKSATEKMYALLSEYRANNIKDEETAVGYLRELANMGGSLKVANDIENEIYTKDKPGYKAIFEGFDSYVTNSIKKDDTQTKQLSAELKENLRDLVRSGMSYNDVQKRKDMAISILAGKSADYAKGMMDKGGFVEGEFRTIQKQENELMKEIAAGELDDLISYDSQTGQIKYAGNSQKVINQLIDTQKDVLGGMGRAVMVDFEKQGKTDITAWPIYTDSRTGEKIKFFPTEEGTAEPYIQRKRRDGSIEWQPLIKTPPKQRPEYGKIDVPEDVWIGAMP